MARRPRPTTRPAPHKAQQKSLPKETSEVSNESSASDEPQAASQQESDTDDDESAEISADDSEDADAPRVVQWVDDEDDWQQADEEPEAGPSTSRSTKRLDLHLDLSTLSMGTLRNAQRTLLRAEAIESSDEDEDEDRPQPASAKGKGKEVVEWSAHPKPVIQSRVSKHAPVEVTSKRPVSRKRTVVDVKTVQARDPRFLPLSGEFSSEKFSTNYSFLFDAHKNELQTLRENAKLARKLLQSSPKHLREEREAEVSKLELAVKRAESNVNRDKRTQIEREALQRVKKDEKEKRQQGKQSWYMKESEKKTMLTKARYEALAASGGERAVKKAIEKRQKKIGQKEKKSRPFGQKRSAPRENGQGEGRFNKRRKIE
ncbi:hypothetical protein CPB85DRAFT_1372164 [Mucidula mucida]|nr:hypothetical protein CPB85DRAFT_1372164 [Mucidula mucida]